MTKNCCLSIAFGISFLVAACNKEANKDVRIVKGTILRQVDSLPYGNTTFKIHSSKPKKVSRLKEDVVNNVFTTDSQGRFAVQHTFKGLYQNVYVAWPDGDADADGTGGFPFQCFMRLPNPLTGAKGEDIDLGTIYAPEP